MDPTAYNIAWLDLETTGTDEADGSILEVGVAITSPDLDVLAVAEWLAEPDMAHVATMAPVVREMHTANGLLDELDRVGGVPIGTLDAELRSLLDAYAVRGRLVLAGSGVSHFDGRWIRRHLPDAARRLTYWTFDVGVVRRWLATIDPELVRPAPAKTHRALDDARDHLAEWRHYSAVAGEALTELRRAAARPVG